jgi:hypothetical protein
MTGTRRLRTRNFIRSLRPADSPAAPRCQPAPPLLASGTGHQRTVDSRSDHWTWNHTSPLPDRSWGILGPFSEACLRAYAKSKPRTPSRGSARQNLQRQNEVGNGLCVRPGESHESLCFEKFRQPKVNHTLARVGGRCLAGAIDIRNSFVNKELVSYHTRRFRVATISPISICG